MSDDERLIREVRAMTADGLSRWETDLQAREGRRPSVEDTRAFGESAIRQAIAAVNRAEISNGRPGLGKGQEDRIAQVVRSKMFGKGSLDAVLADPEVENVVANGCDNVWITKAGGVRMKGPPLADSDAELIELIRRMARTGGNTERRFDDAHPMLDLRLDDGSRLHAVMAVCPRPAVSIRKHRHLRVSLEDLVRLGTLSQQLAHTLAAAIAPPSPCSIVVAGGTDTGKTTFARGLISQIPPDTRIVVVEDNAELGLCFDPARAPHVVEMEVRQPNIEGVGGIGMEVLGRNALRMRPDRLIIGETRSGLEVRTMLEAMNSGHEGSLTTIHADSSSSALTKMQTLALTGSDSLEMEASAHLISLVLHLVVHLAKLPDGRRVVTSVREVTGAHGGTVQSSEVFKLAPGESVAVPTAAGFSPRLLDRLIPAGFDQRILRVVA